jgi:succinoglycan biosynthesis transport protein ExoP
VELSGYFAVARRWWWTLLVAAWVAGLAGYYVASRIPPTYESSVQLLVGPINTDTATVTGSSKLIQTYAQVITTPTILDQTIKARGLSMSAGELATNTRVTANIESRILTIRVQDGNAQQAMDLANEMASQLIEFTNAGVIRPEGTLAFMRFAELVPDPVAPQISLIVLLATLAGIIAAIILVLLIEYFGRSIRNREELARLTGAPVLGSVPAPSKSLPHPNDLVDDLSSAATAYRLLAGRIVYGEADDVLRSLAVVDVQSDTGAAVVAINLGRALARLGRRVVVIDSGSRSTLAGVYGIEPVPGVRDVLNREAQVRSAVRVIADRLALMPAGYEGNEVVDPERARAVIGELLTSADVVIVAAPPVQAGPAALSWARAVDGTVLVARRDHARREDAEAAAETLVHVGGNLIGAIIDERPAPLSGVFGRGRSTRLVPPPPRPTPMASPMPPASSASTGPYRPATAPPPPQAMPSATRPTVVRASAPVAPPTEAEPDAEPAVRPTGARPRQGGRSGPPRNRPTDPS